MTSDPDDLFLAWRDAGDLRALGRLFDAQAPLLLALARHLCRSREDAEDAVQSTFLIAMERASSFDASRRLQPWLAGILAMHARKLRERRGRAAALVSLEELEREHHESPERLAIERELELAIDAALARLPAAYAPLLRRHVLEGLPPRELARHFGLNDATTRARVRRGLQMLRTALSAGLGGAAGAQSLSRRSLGTVRRAVVLRGAQLVGAPAPAASGSALWLALAACALLLLVTGAAAWLRRGSTHVADAEFELTSRAADVATQPALEAGATALPEKSRTAAAANSSKLASAPAHVVSGRLLAPDGAPAASIELVRRHSSPSESARALYDEPSPEPEGPVAVTDSEGVFSFVLAQSPPAPFSLRASAAGCAPLEWLIYVAGEGPRIDLGVACFESAAVVEVELVDNAGDRTVDGWSVSLARDPQSARGQHRLAYRSKLAADAGARRFRTEHAPAGRLNVSASHNSGVRISGIVEAISADVARVELRYAGPDLTRRVTVRLTGSLLARLAPPPAESLVLRGAGFERRFEPVSNAAPGLYVLDGAPPGESFEVELADARFEPLVVRNVEAGKIAELPARGAAAVRVRIVDGSGQRIEAPYALAASIVSAAGASTDVLLRDLSTPAPGDGLVRGLICGVELELSLRAPPAGARRQRLLPLAPGEVREIEFVHDTSRALGGRVVDSDGVALEGVLVELSRGSLAGHARAVDRVVGPAGVVPRRERWMRTDDDGRFRFEELDQGPWTVAARLSAGLWVQQFATADGEVTLELPPHGVLAVRMLAPPGADLTAVELEAWPLVGGASAGLARGIVAPLDADGRARLGPLPLGPCRLVYTVRARFNDGEAWSPIELGSHEVLAADAPERELDARSSFPARAEVELQLDGAPGAGAWVELALVGDANAARLMSVTADRDGARRRSDSGASTDAAGRVLLPNLRPGPARLVVIAPDDSWAWRAESVVEIAPAAALRLPIRLESFERTVQLLAHDGDTPLAEREIELVTQMASGLHRAKRRTDSQGRITLRIPAQWVGFALPGGDPATPAPVNLAWGAGAELLRVRIPGAL